MNRLFVLTAMVLAMAYSCATQAACLSTEPGEITWHLPTQPIGPSWGFQSPAMDVGNNLERADIEIVVWRRPCDSTGSQLILTVRALSGHNPVLGMFTIFQRGFVAHPFFMIVNDPSAYGGNRFPLMPSQSAGPGISGIIDSDEIFNPGTENIDFDAPFTLAFAASWPVANTATTATLEIPAYNPDDYGVGGGDFTVGPGISGNWYNRDQSGHGFVIEMLPNGGMLADWYVFAPEGGATWIIAQGSADGDTAVLDAYQKVGSGGRFPPDFDASRLENRFWGTITFTFDDCNNGVASWESVVPGYSNGSMAITRLTMPAGLSCQ